MEEKKPLISVIVPVYNVENYLHKCVDSILAQTLNDFELILVDDGSPDNCGDICDEYAKKDGRVRVIHKQNGGVSSARNAGIELAKGEWLCFVDGDDVIETDYLSNFMISIDRVDLYLQGYKEVSQNGDVICIHNFHSSNNMEQSDILVEAEREYIINSPCFKLFRTSIVKEKNLLFDVNTSYGEDHLFTYSYLQFADYLKQYNSVGYIVNREIEGSLSTKLVPFNEICYFTNKLYALQLGLINKYKNTRLLLRIFNQRWYLNVRRMVSDSSKRGFLTEELKEIKKQIRCHNNYCGISFRHSLLLVFVAFAPRKILKMTIN